MLCRWRSHIFGHKKAANTAEVNFESGGGGGELNSLAPAELIPKFLDQLVALGEIARQLKQTLGSNGHKAEKVQGIREYLQHQANK